MDKIRKRWGKDLHFKWNVNVNQGKIDLSELDLKVVMTDFFGNVIVCPHTLSGRMISWDFLASQQTNYGEYGITLWANYLRTGQSAVDIFNKFELVPTTDMETPGGDDTALDFVTVDLGDTEMAIGLPGSPGKDGKSIYDLMVEAGKFEGTEEEFIRIYAEAIATAQETAAKVVDALKDVQAAIESVEEAERLVGEAENIRTNNESTRIDNEQERAKNEQERSAEEQRRILTENARRTNESNRQTQETFRQNDENLRTRAEEERQRNEALRQNQEINREIAESKRNAHMEESKQAVDGALDHVREVSDTVSALVERAEPILESTVDATEDALLAKQAAEEATERANSAAGTIENAARRFTTKSLTIDDNDGEGVVLMSETEGNDQILRLDGSIDIPIIRGIGTPKQALDAVNKAYVDAKRDPRILTVYDLGDSFEDYGITVADIAKYAFIHFEYDKAAIIPNGDTKGWLVYRNNEWKKGADITGFTGEWFEGLVNYLMENGESIGGGLPEGYSVVLIGEEGTEDVEPVSFEVLITAPQELTEAQKSQVKQNLGITGTGGGSGVPLVDNLTSTSTTSALTANQGKVLKDLVDGKQAVINASNKLPYSYISGTPAIPAAVTESTVSGWGFTKNAGTYSKPSGGIPKSDLDSTVRDTLDKVDALYEDYSAALNLI